MISIGKIGFYLPETKICNFAKKDDFDIGDQFITDKIGIVSVRIKNTDEDTSDMCVKAYLDLQKKSGCKNDDIECLIVCTQNPDCYGIPHTSAIVHDKLSLGLHCAVFDVSLGCSGYVYCLSIIKAFMESNSFKKGVLITADPYSKIVNENDKNTSLLFGDAATATLLTKTDQNVWQMGHFLFGCNGKESESIKVNSKTMKLEMDGYSIYNFVHKTIPAHIKETLSVNNLSVDKINKFILHQGSKAIIDMARKKLDVPTDKLEFSARDYGNTVSSSIPMILKDTSVDNQYVLITGFGVGLSWASCVLKRK